MSQPIPFKIFLSSPGDVAVERGLALEVIDSLNYDPLIRGKMTLEAVAWDRPQSGAPMLATMTPQQAINEGMTLPSACDMVLVIFWSRMGTPLPENYTKPDGSRYLSGTEWEYEDAVLAAETKGRPHVLVYRRTEEPKVSLADPDLAEKQQQWHQLERFFERFMSEDGSLQRGFNTYLSPSDFKTQIEHHIKTLLKRQLAVIDEDVIAPEKERLINEIAQRDTPHYRRATIGERLREVGDPRSGVGLTAEGIPDILWKEVPGGHVQLVEAKAKAGSQTFEVQPCRISQYTITYGQFKAFLDAEDGYANPLWWQGIGSHRDQPSQSRPFDNHPVEYVSWYDSVAFCRWLSSRLGFEVRLPTEWEWQQAATGGNPTNIFPWGSNWETTYANSRESELLRTTAVGMYSQNVSPIGAMDMIGNVWEWCLNELDDPTRVELAGTRKRSVRGCSCLSRSHKAHITYRAGNIPSRRPESHGFRVVAP